MVIAALNNPTKPEVLTESNASSTVGSSQPPDSLPLFKAMDATLAPPSFAMSRGTTPTILGPFAEWNNEVFDPLSWTLDGLVELPYPNGIPSDYEVGMLGI
jgi:hypothetical protein